jgi:hypothetical protein
LFEVGVNVSSELTDRLRAGVQVFARNVGSVDQEPRIDWAFADYRWQQWLGFRAGIIKMPFGLYNEHIDIDSAHVPILLPQAVYPLRNRDVLLSQTGVAAYGNYALGAAGELDYQAWLGTLTIPRSALELVGASLDEVDDKYVTGAQLFWSPPVEGLRIGGTYLRASIDFRVTLDAATVDQLIMLGLVPADFDGELVISQRPDTLVVGSAEYVHDELTLAAEYSRWLKHQQTTLSMLIPAFDEDAERFYALASYRLSSQLEAGAYYSAAFKDVDDRGGRDEMVYPERYYAFQRDAAMSLRYDVNDHWLWKLEGHFIDGTADLSQEVNAAPDRYWGLFLFKTTVWF